MTILEEDFTTGQVIKAANIKNHTLQTWIKRGVIVGLGDQQIDMPGQPGIRRKFNFFSLIQIAVAKELIDLGMDVPAAFVAATHYAHWGDEERNPGLPFRDGTPTVLCAAGDRAAVVKWSNDSHELITSVRRRLNWPAGFIFLDVNPIFDRVVAALGHHPQTVLDRAYS